LIGNREFNATKTLQVKNKGSSGGSGGGSGGGGSGGHTTTAMPPSGGEAGILEEQPIVSQDVTEVTVEQKEEQAKPVEQAKSKANVTEEPEGVGVGQAAGWFNLDKINWQNLLWVIAGILAIAVVMKLMAGKGRDERGIRYSEIDKYIKDRRKNFRD
jgi:hypothetical protein